MMTNIYEIHSAINGIIDIFIRSGTQIVLTKTRPGQTSGMVVTNCDMSRENLGFMILHAHVLAGQKNTPRLSCLVEKEVNRIMDSGIDKAARVNSSRPNAAIDADGNLIDVEWKPGPKIDHDNVLDIRYGDLWGQNRHICSGSQLFAIFVDFCPDAPMLIKYGAYPAVSAYASKFWENMEKHMPDMARTEEIMALPVHPEIIEELNCCLACSGRIGQFKGFLENFQSRHPDMKIKPYQLIDINNA